MPGAELHIELIIALLAIVAAMALAGEKLRVPYPILLVIAGLGISLIPNLPVVQVSPNLVFYVILPPLLFWAGILTSWRDFLKNIRPILLLAIGLVLATTFAVAGVAYWLVPGLSFAAACVLGAIISPPDAVAATSVIERLKVPRRIVSILEGESLVNDATALVTLSFAVAAVVEGTFSLPRAGLQFVWLCVGGVGVGLLVGLLAIYLRKRVHESHVEGIISLLTPYFAYLPAEAMHCSGVLAVVTAGIFLSRQLPKSLTASSRMRQAIVWDTLVFILNGGVFLLIGLHLPVVIRNIRERDTTTIAALVGQSLAIAATAIVVRIAWIFFTVGVARLFPAFTRRDPVPEKGALLVVSWAGMRGIVSLAAALAVPVTIGVSATPFPGRDQILFITFVVILVTLVLQGLTLPLVIRWARLTDDSSALVEERQARLEGAHAAMSRLSVLEMEETLDPGLIETLRTQYDQRIRALGGTLRDELDPTMAVPIEQMRRVRRELLEAERAMLTLLRDQHVIGDDVLRRILHEIDMETANLA